DKARDMFNAAMRLFRDAGDDQGVALVIRHIAFIDRVSGRLDDAARRYEQALSIFRKTSDHVAAAYVLHGLAHVKLELCQIDEAKLLLSRLCGSAGPRDARGSRHRCSIGWARRPSWPRTRPTPSPHSAWPWPDPAISV